MEIVLCCGESGCPSVEVTEDGAEIGESGEKVNLSPDEWNAIVGEIQEGNLGKI